MTGAFRVSSIDSLITFSYKREKSSCSANFLKKASHILLLDISESNMTTLDSTAWAKALKEGFLSNSGCPYFKLSCTPFFTRLSMKTYANSGSLKSSTTKWDCVPAATIKRSRNAAMYWRECDWFSSFDVYLRFWIYFILTSWLVKPVVLSVDSRDTLWPSGWVSHSLQQLKKNLIASI